MKKWTETQKNRLTELDADTQEIAWVFEGEKERNKAFQTLEMSLVKAQKIKLAKLRDTQKRPGLCLLSDKLVQVLTSKGFVQVTTPTMMAKSLLKKMSITDSHPLTKQIFWVDSKRCLRPMLAPHLYYIMKDLLRIWEKPIGIFEIGSCFRKESEGARHTNEFTMLNVCEFGVDCRDLIPRRCHDVLPVYGRGRPRQILRYRGLSRQQSTALSYPLASGSPLVCLCFTQISLSGRN